MKRMIQNWNSLGGNPATEIWKPIALGKSPDRGVWRNFKPLPNVKSFRLQMKWWDSILLKFKIFKVQDPVMEIQRYRNAKINRYIKHQLIRLDKHANRIQEKIRKSDGKLSPLSSLRQSSAYWVLADALMKRSRCFRIQALQHVFPRWYKEMPIHQVVNLLVKVGILANTPRGELDYARVYVEKAKDKWRPLGVPSPSWRVYLHMMAQFFSYVLDPVLSDSQHGFRPQRGTMTAWVKVLTEVIEEQDIFEFDMAKFFDSVDQKIVFDILMWRMGMPDSWNKRLRTICASRIKLPKETKIEEKHFTDHMKAKMDALFFFLLPQNMWGKVIHSAKPTGFPQGAPISPILSLLALEPTILSMGVPIVMYADDGIIYGKGVRQLVGDQPKVTEKLMKDWRLTAAGISLNEEKSGWVRKNGVWLRPLKFLGLEYNGETGQLCSLTRKGKTLVYDKEKMLEQLNERDGLGKVQGQIRLHTALNADGTVSYRETVQKNNFVEFCRSRFKGFVMDRLYNGSWNQEKLWGSMRLKPRPGSFVEELKKGTIKGLILDNFNASSVSVRGVMDIWKIVSAVHPKADRDLKQALLEGIRNWNLREEGDPATAEGKKRRVKDWINKANFVNRGRWLSAYNGTYRDYCVFVNQIIEDLHANPRVRNWRVISKEEMWRHYNKKYSEGMDFSGQGRSQMTMRYRSGWYKDVTKRKVQASLKDTDR